MPYQVFVVEVDAPESSTAGQVQAAVYMGLPALSGDGAVNAQEIPAAVEVRVGAEAAE